MAKALKLVQIPKPQPPCLLDRAGILWDNEILAAKWLAAVKYLRENSKKGWAIDKIILKSPEQRVL